MFLINCLIIFSKIHFKVQQYKGNWNSVDRKRNRRLIFIKKTKKFQGLPKNPEKVFF